VNESGFARPPFGLRVQKVWKDELKLQAIFFAESESADVISYHAASNVIFAARDRFP
jgi:hypothetical protein